MKLYEISTELKKIDDQLITNEGEITPELETRLDELNLALEQKASGLRKWLAVIDSDTTALDNEIKRLTTIKKQKENLVERLKAYIHKNMIVADLKKIETPIGTFTVAKNPPSLECVSPEMTPVEFTEEIPAHREPDKKKIKEALTEGYDVAGWKLITDKTHLKIK